LTVCSNCQSSLEGIAAVALSKRQVFDIPVPKVVCTEHQGEVKICPCCGERSTASFPPETTAPVQYGDTIKAWAVYLQHRQFITEDRLQELFRDLLGVAPAPATLVAYSQLAYEHLAGFEAQVLAQLETAPVVTSGCKLTQVND
jgi:transposase